MALSLRRLGPVCGRSRGRLGLVWAVVLAALVWPASSAQAFAFRVKGEGWLYGFGERSAYFDPEANYAWLEAMLRAQATLEMGAHLVIEARGVGYATLGADYYRDLEFYDFEAEPGVDTYPLPSFKKVRYNAAIDLLSVNLERLAGGRITLKAGRQEILYGEGFLLGDGYDEFGDLYYTRQRAATHDDHGFGGAGQYIIPVKRWDALRLSVDLSPVTIDAMVARLDPTLLPDPSIREWPILPGMVAGLDVARDGDYLDLGLTAVGRRVFETDEIAPGELAAVALRASGEVGNTKLEGEVVGEVGREGVLAGEGASEGEGTASGLEPVVRRGLGARFNLRHTWSMNPYTPYLKLGGYFFSGDNPETEVLEAYDPLFYDWSDFGRWYFGNISSAQWFGNSDNMVAEVQVGFQPTPLQNLRLLLFQTFSQTGYTVCGEVLELDSCDAGAVGPFEPLVLEANLVWDWSPVEVGRWKPDGRFYFGALAGVAVPVGPMRVEMGESPSLEAMLFMTVSL